MWKSPVGNNSGVCTWQPTEHRVMTGKDVFTNPVKKIVKLVNDNRVSQANSTEKY